MKRILFATLACLIGMAIGAHADTIFQNGLVDTNASGTVGTFNSGFGPTIFGNSGGGIMFTAPVGNGNPWTVTGFEFTGISINQIDNGTTEAFDWQFGTGINTFGIPNGNTIMSGLGTVAAHTSLGQSVDASGQYLTDFVITLPTSFTIGQNCNDSGCSNQPVWLQIQNGTDPGQTANELQWAFAASGTDRHWYLSPSGNNYATGNSTQPGLIFAIDGTQGSGGPPPSDTIEASTLVLMGSGLLGLAGLAKRRKLGAALAGA